VFTIGNHLVDLKNELEVTSYKKYKIAMLLVARHPPVCLLDCFEREKDWAVNVEIFNWEVYLPFQSNVFE